MSKKNNENSSEVLTLDQLVARDGGGDEEGVELGNKGSGTGSPFDSEYAYPVEVVAQEIKVSEKGYHTLALTLGVIQPDGSVVETGKAWETLPIFTDDLKEKLGSETAGEYRNSFGQNLHGLLRALDPKNFSTYARLDKTNAKNWKFYDVDGNLMTKADKAASELEKGRLVMRTAKALAAGQTTLVGQRAFYHRNKSKKLDKNGQPKYYNNWYSQEPTSVKLISDKE